MKLIEIARFTDKVAETTEFYRIFLGREPVEASDDQVIFVEQGVKIVIQKMYDPEEEALPPEEHLAFAVDDVDATCAGLEQQGLSVEVPPQDFYWGRSAFLRAPDGQLVELIKETDATG